MQAKTMNLIPDNFIESYETTLRRTQVSSAGKHVHALYAKTKAEQNAALEAGDYVLWNKICEITCDLAGILGILGFSLNGEQK